MRNLIISYTVNTSFKSERPSPLHFLIVSKVNQTQRVPYKYLTPSKLRTEFENERY
jgi:hypothetical protein